MNVKVNIDYEQLKASIKEILSLLNDVGTYNVNLESIINSNDSWNSDYEKVFHNHIKQETIPMIEKILTTYIDYISRIEKSIKGYQKLDKY